MKFIEVEGKKFKLASPTQRLKALLIDIAYLFGISILFYILILLHLSAVEELGPIPEELGYGASYLTEISFPYFSGIWGSYVRFLLYLLSNPLFLLYVSLLFSIPVIFLWIFGLFSDVSIGKRKLVLQVLRLTDGKPCTTGDAFMRRLTLILLPLDLLWLMGQKRQRLGDKFAGTVVVDLAWKMSETVVEDPEQNAIDELKERLSAAKQQIETSMDELKERLSAAKQHVENSIALETEFHDTYEDIATQAEVYEARAVTAVEEGQENVAREELKKRNEYRQLAEGHKTRWERQKQIVKHHTTLLETLEQYSAEIKRKQDIINTQHINVDAETHLREMLKEIREFDELKKRLFEAQQKVEDASAIEKDPEMSWDLQTKSIKGATEKFELASRASQLYAFFIDFMIDFMRWHICLLIWLWLFVYFADALPFAFLTLPIPAILAFFYICYSEQPIIKTTSLGIQVLRLKDGEPCTFANSLVRRLTGFLQPLDLLWLIGQKRQRLGDFFARTVAVKLKSETPDVAENPEEIEIIIELTVAELKTRLSAVLEKVEAAIEVEKQLKAAYESAIVRADRGAEREGFDPEAPDIRDAYRRLAGKYKTQWEEQCQEVLTLRSLFLNLQQRVAEIEGQTTAMAVQQRNIDTEAQLRETLEDIQKDETLQTVEQVEQEATEAAALAKAAVELDVAYQDVKVAVEFSGYAEEASINKEIEALKAKLQK